MYILVGIRKFESVIESVNVQHLCGLRDWYVRNLIVISIVSVISIVN